MNQVFMITGLSGYAELCLGSAACMLCEPVTRQTTLENVRVLDDSTRSLMMKQVLEVIVKHFSRGEPELDSSGVNKL